MQQGGLFIYRSLDYVCEETFSSTQGVVASSIEVVMKMKEGGVTKKTFSKYWNVTPNLSTFGLLFN